MFFKILLTTIFLFLSFSISYAGQSFRDVPTYDLSISLNIKESVLSGVAQISVKKGKELEINIGKMIVKDIYLNNKKIEISGKKEQIIKITPEDDGILTIKYEAIFDEVFNETDNIEIKDEISEKGVMLTDLWYPSIRGLYIYKLKVLLPEGFEAISEAEVIQKRSINELTEFIFDFPYPIDKINLIASDKYRIIKDKTEDIEIFTYFFEEDLPLAEQYIDFTKKYIRLYEELVGKFPYKRFSIVENFFPTGYSMPTFTLLGKDVIRLPFIVETSLGHEILHQWFGGSVYIDYEKGNWAEGLTTYLADHLYEELKGRSGEYRKQTLIDYMSYVKEDKDFPLKEFRERFDFPSKAIGYGKGSMVFHMLRRLVGDDAFNKSIKDIASQKKFEVISWDDIRDIFSFNYSLYKSIKEFSEKNKDKKQSWKDLQISIEKNLKEGLDWFFRQWIDEKGAIDIKLSDIKLKQSGSNFDVSFSIIQEGKNFIFDLPVTVYLLNGDVKKEILRIDKQNNDFTLSFKEEPQSIVLDEDYDLFRRLTSKEMPPTIANLIGEEDIIIVLPEDKDLYEDVINYFKEKGAQERLSLKESDIKGTLLLLGKENKGIKRLFGKIDEVDAGFSLVVKKNPFSDKNVIAILDARSKDEIRTAFKKIFHYTRYSAIAFDKGRNIFKSIDSSEKGIREILMEEPLVIDTSALKTLKDVVEAVSGKKIVYVGEFHDRFAHHNIQLQIIKGLYERDKKIAIGMEMFQRPFQDILNKYISGEIDEREFLKDSEYFKRWGFDYNLYKPILDFARQEKIPLIALNIEREIIDRVSKNGLDSLSDEEISKIPSEIDFSDMDYRERLKNVFKMHGRTDERNFDYFYQSQLLWDETMAESIDNFLRKNKDYKIIVLAGGGHIAYGSGIPKRAFRRNQLPYGTIMIDTNIDKDVADFVIYPKPLEGITSPKLMAYLREEGGFIEIVGFPEDSISEKAGLKKGDRIISVDDEEISTIEDLRIHLFYKKKGDILKIKVLRKRFLFGDREMVFEIKL